MAVSLPRRRNRGQVLIVTSLVVVMLLVSAVAYVNETQKNTPVSLGENGLGVSAVRQAVEHAVVSALVNVTSGGNSSVLLSDLSLLETVLSHGSYSSIVNLRFAPLNSLPYVDGFRISWNETGVGFSGGCVSYSLNSSGTLGSCFSESEVQVTSSIEVSGSYVSLNESLVEVNVYCLVWNDGEPAAAESLDVLYRCGGSGQWLSANTPNITGYGNGTYLVSFQANIAGEVDPMQVSMHVQDGRGVSVWANATCLQR